MSEDIIKTVTIRIIGRIAPEASLERIDPNRRFRDQFDFDSVDFLNFIMELQQEFNIRIPEIDYPNLGTLKGCIEYLQPVIGNNEPSAQQDQT